jgi:cytochrome c oxidase assembly factor 6
MNRVLSRERLLTIEQVDYFKKQRVVNYQKEQTIKKIESEGGEIVAPQLPTRGPS